MRREMRSVLWAFGTFVVACLISVTTGNVATAQPDSSSVLVTPEWVEKNSDQIRLIGMGQTKENYDQAHIPGELFVDWRTDITDPEHADRFNLPPKEKLEQLLSRLGVTKSTMIVLTDNLSSRLSTRMYWTLKCYGHEHVKLLDGGRGAWEKSGRKFTSEIPKIEPTQYVAGPKSMTHYANLEIVQKCVKNKSAVLVDGRPPLQFTGEMIAKAFHTGKEHKRKGHIVDAKNITWKDNFTPEGKFKSAQELRELYDSAGVTKDQKVVTYCNEGLHAAPPWFVLTELLGRKNVRLYDDSMCEWANLDDTPMATSVANKK